MKTNNQKIYPTYKTNYQSLKWSALFLIDLLFEFSQKSKNEKGHIIKKESNTSLIGRKFQNSLKKNIKKLNYLNRDFVAGSPINLDEIDAIDLTSEFFNKWRNTVNSPLVIRQFLKDAPIMELTNETNLISNFGDAKVQCADFNIDKKTSGAGQNTRLIQTTLEDYLNSSGYENFYINNFHGLLNQTDFYRLCKGRHLQKIQKHECILNQWFIKRGLNSRSALHCANGENIFLNVQGRKEWHFIHPSYTPVLQTTLSKYGIYSISEIMNFNDKEDFYSLITKRHNYFHKIPIFKTILEPGDILYNPPWWWHDVRNLTSFTMGCASRWTESKDFISNSPTLFMGQMVELIKYPTKSPYSILRKKGKQDQFIDSIFSKKWSETQNR